MTEEDVIHEGADTLLESKDGAELTAEWAADEHCSEQHGSGSGLHVSGEEPLPKGVEIRDFYPTLQEGEECDEVESVLFNLDNKIAKKKGEEVLPTGIEVKDFYPVQTWNDGENICEDTDDILRNLDTVIAKKKNEEPLPKGFQVTDFYPVQNLEDSQECEEADLVVGNLDAKIANKRWQTEKYGPGQKVEHNDDDNVEEELFSNLNLRAKMRKNTNSSKNTDMNSTIQLSPMRVKPISSSSPCTTEHPSECQAGYDGPDELYASIHNASNLGLGFDIHLKEQQTLGGLSMRTKGISQAGGNHLIDSYAEVNPSGHAWSDTDSERSQLQKATDVCVARVLEGGLLDTFGREAALAVYQAEGGYHDASGTSTGQTGLATGFDPGSCASVTGSGFPQTETSGSTLVDTVDTVEIAAEKDLLESLSRGMEITSLISLTQDVSYDSDESSIYAWVERYVTEEDDVTLEDNSQREGDSSRPREERKSNRSKRREIKDAMGSKKRQKTEILRTLFPHRLNVVMGLEYQLEMLRNIIDDGLGIQVQEMQIQEMIQEVEKALKETEKGVDEIAQVREDRNEEEENPRIKKLPPGESLSKKSGRGLLKPTNIEYLDVGSKEARVIFMREAIMEINLLTRKEARGRGAGEKSNDAKGGTKTRSKTKGNKANDKRSNFKNHRQESRLRFLGAVEDEVLLNVDFSVYCYENDVWDQHHKPFLKYTTPPYSPAEAVETKTKALHYIYDELYPSVWGYLDELSYHIGLEEHYINHIDLEENSDSFDGTDLFDGMRINQLETILEKENLDIHAGLAPLNCKMISGMFSLESYNYFKQQMDKWLTFYREYKGIDTTEKVLNMKDPEIIGEVFDIFGGIFLPKYENIRKKISEDLLFAEKKSVRKFIKAIEQDKTKKKTEKTRLLKLRKKEILTKNQRDEYLFGSQLLLARGLKRVGLKQIPDWALPASSFSNQLLSTTGSNLLSRQVGAEIEEVKENLRMKFMSASSKYSRMSRAFFKETELTSKSKNTHGDKLGLWGQDYGSDSEQEETAESIVLEIVKNIDKKKIEANEKNKLVDIILRKVDKKVAKARWAKEKFGSMNQILPTSMNPTSMNQATDSKTDLSSLDASSLDASQATVGLGKSCRMMDKRRQVEKKVSKTGRQKVWALSPGEMKHYQSAKVRDRMAQTMGFTSGDSSLNQSLSLSAYGGLVQSAGEGFRQSVRSIGEGLGQSFVKGKFKKSVTLEDLNTDFARDIAEQVKELEMKEFLSSSVVTSEDDEEILAVLRNVDLKVNEKQQKRASLVESLSQSRKKPSGDGDKVLEEQRNSMQLEVDRIEFGMSTTFTAVDVAKGKGDANTPGGSPGSLGSGKDTGLTVDGKAYQIGGSSGSKDHAILDTVQDGKEDQSDVVGLIYRSIYGDDSGEVQIIPANQKYSSTGGFYNGSKTFDGSFSGKLKTSNIKLLFSSNIKDGKYRTGEQREKDKKKGKRKKSPQHTKIPIEELGKQYGIIIPEKPKKVGDFSPNLKYSEIYAKENRLAKPFQLVPIGDEVYLKSEARAKLMLTKVKHQFAEDFFSDLYKPGAKKSYHENFLEQKLKRFEKLKRQHELEKEFRIKQERETKLAEYRQKQREKDMKKKQEKIEALLREEEEHGPNAQKRILEKGKKDQRATYNHFDKGQHHNIPTGPAQKELPKILFKKKIPPGSEPELQIYDNLNTKLQRMSRVLDNKAHKFLDKVIGAGSNVFEDPRLGKKDPTKKDPHYRYTRNPSWNNLNEDQLLEMRKTMGIPDYDGLMDYPLDGKYNTGLTDIPAMALTAGEKHYGATPSAPSTMSYGNYGSGNSGGHSRKLPPVGNGGGQLIGRQLINQTKVAQIKTVYGVGK